MKAGRKLLLCTFFTALSGFVLANEESHKKEPFKPGNFIFEHISDSHEWHILTWKDHHVSIPLPIILYSTHSGLSVFSSAQFHHSDKSYRNFTLEKDGPRKGKIIETLPDGSSYEPLDFSITKNVLSVILSATLLVIILLSVSNRYRKRENMPPKGLQSMLEPIIIFLRDEVAKPAIGHGYEKFMPYLLTLFFFIWFNNILGLMPVFPGGANVTGNISVTLVLAIITFFITLFSGNRHYWKEIFNPDVPWWLKFPIPLIPVLELMAIFTKPFVLMVRLFANITAGHIIALGFFCLIFIFGEIQPMIGYGVSVLSVCFVIFMSLLELLVAFIQAYVFTLLTALYFGMARAEHH